MELPKNQPSVLPPIKLEASTSTINATILRRPVVIDACNVGRTHSGPGRPYVSCLGILECTEYFLDRGHQVSVFIPLHFRSISEVKHQYILDELFNLQILAFTPLRRIDDEENKQSITSYDDLFIIESASKVGAVVISNDSYSDVLIEHPEWSEVINDRKLQIKWRGAGKTMKIFKPCNYRNRWLAEDALLCFPGEADYELVRQNQFLSEKRQHILGEIRTLLEQASNEPPEDLVTSQPVSRQSNTSLKPNEKRSGYQRLPPTLFLKNAERNGFWERTDEEMLENGAEPVSNLEKGSENVVSNCFPRNERFQEITISADEFEDFAGSHNLGNEVERVDRKGLSASEPTENGSTASAARLQEVNFSTENQGREFYPCGIQSLGVQNVASPCLPKDLMQHQLPKEAKEIQSPSSSTQKMLSAPKKQDADVPPTLEDLISPPGPLVDSGNTENNISKPTEAVGDSLTENLEQERFQAVAMFLTDEFEAGSHNPGINAIKGVEKKSKGFFSAASETAESGSTSSVARLQEAHVSTEKHERELDPCRVSALGVQNIESHCLLKDVLGQQHIPKKAKEVGTPSSTLKIPSAPKKQETTAVPPTLEDLISPPGPLVDTGNTANSMQEIEAPPVLEDLISSARPLVDTRNTENIAEPTETAGNSLTGNWNREHVQEMWNQSDYCEDAREFLSEADLVLITALSSTFEPVVVHRAMKENPNYRTVLTLANLIVDRYMA